MKDEINFYFGKKEYGWLSNFFECSQKVDGLSYSSNEYYYQSKKVDTRTHIGGNIRHWILSAPSSYLAMIAGRALRKNKELVGDWDSMKVDVMLKGLRAKFKNPELRKKLLATGDAVIHEDSSTDMFWGKKGEDMLGKLLMQVRSEIANEIE